jgi:hypothetical protein
VRDRSERRTDHLSTTVPHWRGRHADEGIVRRLFLALAAVIIATATAWSWLSVTDETAQPWRPGASFVALFEPPRTDIERHLRMGDGQAYAALATDPLLRDVSPFRDGPREAAYRWQRPIFGWLGALTSRADVGDVAGALLGLTIASAALCVLATADLLRAVDRPASMALVVLATPGAYGLARLTGPELLATALGVGAVAWWLRDGHARIWRVAALLSVAALTKETLLLVPVVLGLHALVVDRVPVRRLLPLALPAGVFLAWAAFLRFRIGHFPWEASQGRLTAPFVGIVRASADWSGTSAAILAFLAVATIYALRWSRTHVVTWMVVAHGVMATMLGELVWRGWEDIGRITLPAFAFGIVAIAAALSASQATTRTLAPVTP